MGNYEIGNCRFITHEQNLSERIINGGQTVGITKQSIALRGRSKASHAYLQSSSDKQKGRDKHTDQHIKDRSIRMSKRYRLVSPTGVVHEGANLTEFCDNNQLKQPGMAALCRGNKKIHKGWTGEYI